MRPLAQWCISTHLLKLASQTVCVRENGADLYVSNSVKSAREKEGLIIVFQADFPIQKLQQDEKNTQTQADNDMRLRT